MSNTPLQSVLLPIIRRTLPNLIASQIVGVQPMTNLGARPQESGTYETGSVIWYWVRPEEPAVLDLADPRHSPAYWDEVEAWCTATYGPRNPWAEEISPHRWSASARKYYFRDEADRTMFIMRWT